MRVNADSREYATPTEMMAKIIIATITSMRLTPDSEVRMLRSRASSADIAFTSPGWVEA